MKSLAESIFDSETQMMESLFDKNLATKRMTIGDYFKLDSFGIRDSTLNKSEMAYASILERMDLSKLKKDYPAADLSDVVIPGCLGHFKYSDVKDYTDGLEYFVSFLNDFDIIISDNGEVDNDEIKRLRGEIHRKFDRYVKKHDLTIDVIGRHDGLTFWINHPRFLNNSMWLVYDKK